MAQTVQITANGRTYLIPTDKAQHVIALLEAYSQPEPPPFQQVREVIGNYPSSDGRSLING